MAWRVLRLAMVPVLLAQAAWAGPLAGAVPGDAGRGRALVIGKGNCLACHVMPIPSEPDHGDIGPDLDGIGSRLSAEQLRQRLVDAKTVNPDTIMPSFFRADLHRVAKDWRGQTIFSAQDVEDVVTYLQTLK